MGADDFVLGVWDGHDSGAALVRGDTVLFAINEERLTHRKLEILFPQHSIRACLQFAGITASDVHDIAYTTTDFAKTLTRSLPGLKEEYYQIRRRKTRPSLFTTFKKGVKYRITQIMPSRLTRALSDRVIHGELHKLGFNDYRLHCVDHHTAHAGGAFFSGFEEALVLTLDGIGDGLSGAVYRLSSGRLEKLSGIPGADSLGIFFEHVTNLMNMRELEDEGKVMALANFAYPVPDDKNPMLEMIRVNGTTLESRYSALTWYRRLKDILWQFPAEQFCYMAQRTLEIRVVELVKNLLAQTHLRKVILAGGVASNIKVNRLIRNLPEVEDIFVFPHMGDGGQAIGAACIINNQKHPVTRYQANNFCLGPSYTNQQVEAAVGAFGLPFQKEADAVTAAAQRIAQGQIVMWFQGRMELGPRALGGRSILALPGSLRIKDALNLKLKRRVWYQPFCPTMLEEDARELLEDYSAGSPDRYMTSGYQVKDPFREKVIGVLNVDGTCRPQILSNPQSRYGQLLQKIKQLTGLGVLLNTSLNIHGEPLACSPEDALRAFAASGADALVMEDYIVNKK